MKNIILLALLTGTYLVSFSQNASFVISGSSIKLVNTGDIKLALHNTNFENNAADSAVQGDSEFILTGLNETTMGGLFANNFQKLKIDKIGSSVLLGHHLNVSHQLSLVAGNFDIRSHNLNLGTANLLGGSDLSYIKTSGEGVLKRFLKAGDQLFPVGNTSYNPALLTQAGTSSDTFNIRVADKVTGDGLGLGDLIPHPFVNRSWAIGATKSSGSNNVNIRLHWDEAHEINDFDDSSSFMVRHDGTKWEKLGGLLGSALDKSAHTVNGISHFSTFSVSSHALLVSNILHSLIKVYPIPFVSNFTIEIASKLDEKVQLRLYTISGKLVAERTMLLKIGLNKLVMSDLSQLLPDNYVLVIATNEKLISKRLVKIQ